MKALATDESIPLFGDNSPPLVSELAPDVRSGTTFTYDGIGNVADPIQFVLVVWIYTVCPEMRKQFATKVSQFESDPQQIPGGASVPQSIAGIDYRGTYSVSVSSASPDYEYRTYWGLEHLGEKP